MPHELGGGGGGLYFKNVGSRKKHGKEKGDEDPNRDHGTPRYPS